MFMNKEISKKLSNLIYHNYLFNLKFVKKIRAFIRKYFYLGNKFECPICEKRFRKFHAYTTYCGVPGNTLKTEETPNSICPLCISKVRQRFLWQFLKSRTNLFTSNQKLKLLHFAPEVSLSNIFHNIHNIEFISADLSTEVAENQMDITSIPVKNELIDCILCCHVLEHVPDDLKAITELFRILKNGGFLVIQVPTYGEKTFEDPSVKTDEERLRAYGQKDHVRMYGIDLKKRLEDAGFFVTIYTYFDVNGDYVDRTHHSGQNTVEGNLFYCVKIN